MRSDKFFKTIKGWIYKISPRNVSSQDQFSDHFYPHLASTLFLLALPYGIFVAILVPLFSLYKEFIEDEHWKDLFSNTDLGYDGRCDLYFRLMGSLIAYLTQLW